MDLSKNRHTFVVCAYKESPFLEECIQSLLAQTIKSKIIISTSTPCEYITRVAEKYQLPLYTNPVQGGIASDWNFGYERAETPLITLAHQDDLYEPGYLAAILDAANNTNKPLIIFTDYGELRKEGRVYNNTLLRIKRLILTPMKVKAFWRSKFVRRRVLSVGCPICAPSVTYVKPNLPQIPFLSGYRSDLDWQAWERFSKLEGEFIYCPQPLMLHRIHTGSETSSVIADNRRTVEDREMFSKFWPKPIACMLSKVYQLSERSNQQERDST